MWPAAPRLLGTICTVATVPVPQSKLEQNGNLWLGQSAEFDVGSPCD